MAEHDRDDELSRRYRELAREEPPRALDDAILAAARRELETRPAPLVAPSGRRRWTVPVAAAAVIVLSAVVTLHVQREQPDPEMSVQQSAPLPPASAPARASARKDEAPAVAPPVAQMREEKLASQAKEVDAAKSEPARRQRQAPPPAVPVTPSQAPAGESPGLAQAPRDPKPSADHGRFAPDPGPVAAAPAAPPPALPPQPEMQMREAAPAVKPAPRAADAASSAAASAPPAAAQESRALGGLRDNRMLAKIEAEPPEKMLERIAALRREGRAKEADELYAEFRRRFPDYRIPDALREQVLPR